MLTPGIFGKVYLASGTSVFSAILDMCLGGGSFPFFTHWSMSVINARQYHWIGLGFCFCWARNPDSRRLFYGGNPPEKCCNPARK